MLNGVGNDQPDWLTPTSVHRHGSWQQCPRTPRSSREHKLAPGGCARGDLAHMDSPCQPERELNGSPVFGFRNSLGARVAWRLKLNIPVSGPESAS